MLELYLKALFCISIIYNSHKFRKVQIKKAHELALYALILRIEYPPLTYGKRLKILFQFVCLVFMLQSCHFGVCSQTHTPLHAPYTKLGVLFTQN